MLHRIYLFNPAGADVQLKTTGKWVLPAWLARLRMVVPRSLCTFHRVRCSGVPRFKLRDFARLQAQALSPFVAHGCAATRQGSWLCLWIWDRALEAEFAQKHGIAESGFSVLPLSFYARTIPSGVTCSPQEDGRGVEYLLWKDKLLQDSLWFPVAPTPEEWSALLANTPDLASMGWPDALPSVQSARPSFSQKAWARNLIPQAASGMAFDWNVMAPTVLTVASIGLVGWSASLWSQKAAYQHAIDSLTHNQEQRLAQLEPLQQARQRAQQVIDWVRSAQSLGPVQPTHALINDLAPVITRQGLVVREIDINPPTVQATLTAPGGGSPRLTAVLGALEGRPYIYDARFVDVSGVMGFRFSWRLKDQITPLPAQGGTP
ncbi:hypothetical protein QE399_000526 [Paracidovorax wautersii]|uniref:Tfp pilus assembly protein PilN n=1 Tax=Paracidovorax wautersii TaxID=1177982 RepID=A0ABU1I7L4_9BURK|nr:hypothetical protein [Paracidovorax wautersii]